MSKYTTGEMAKLCGVTVRTVQYYDTRQILIPSELSEGGRRLYSDDDLKRMKIICFLRELGLPIDSISQLLSEEKPENVISILIEQQEQTLRAELTENQKKLEKLAELKSGLKSISHFSVESIGDIALLMKSKEKLKKLHRIMLLIGIPMNIIQWVTIILWVATGVWWPFAVYVPVAILCGLWISKYYYEKAAYICPQCHEVFKPKFGEMFWAKHTPSTRKLTCTYCGYHGFCVETYGGDEK